MKQMEIKLSKKVSMEIFHTAMCNGLGFLESYGLYVLIDKTQYNKSKKKLNMPCIEDVLQQMLLDGYPLDFTDEEAGETHTIYKEDVYKNVCKTFNKSLLNIINEEDDAEDADCVLQTVIFGGVIFG